MMRPAGRIAGHDVDDRDRSARHDARLVRRLLGYLSPYRRDAALAGLALVASAVLQIVAPLVTQTAVDLYLAPLRTTALPTWLPVAPAAGVAALSACYLAAILGAAALDASQAWLTQRAGQRAMSDLRRNLLARLQALDMAWFDRHPSGQLVTRVTTDVDALNDLLTSGLVAILADLVMLVSIAVVMIALSPRLSLVVFAILPFVVLATLAFRRQAASSYRRIRASIGRINAFLAEHFSGMSVVQLFNRQRERLDRFAEVNADNRRAHQDDDVRAALARVALDGVSDWLPDDAAAPVREGGPGLSLGQKQLLAIARAVVREPAYLILDEATSAVDTPTERRIQQSLVRLLRGRTAVVIAHRLSTIRRADRILVMHHGALHESGTHAELLARRGLYWQMHVWQHDRHDDAAAEPLAPIPPAAPARHQLFTERIPG